MDDSGNGESGSGEERSGESGSDEESGSGDEGNGEIFVTSFYFYTPTKFSAFPEHHFIPLILCDVSFTLRLQPKYIQIT